MPAVVRVRGTVPRMCQPASPLGVGTTMKVGSVKGDKSARGTDTAWHRAAQGGALGESVPFSKVRAPNQYLSAGLTH